MRNQAYPFYFVGGALFLYLLFFVLPSIMGFFYAFTDWNSYSSDVNFVGLENFALIFSSSQGYLRYISNTIIFTVVTIVLKTVIALALAVLLTHGVRRLAHLLSNAHLLARGIADAGGESDFQIHPESGDRTVEYIVAWRRAWGFWRNNGWLISTGRCLP